MRRGASWVSVVAALSVAILTWWYVSHAEPVFEPLPAIAFSAETDLRQYDIAVAEDGTVTRLTHDRLSYAPAWSPDGSQIAFIRGRPGSWEECCGYKQERIWVMKADGSDAMPVTDAGVDPTSGPQWTPDGIGLIFTVGRPELPLSEDGSTMVRLDLTTGSLETLIAEYPYYEFALSSDATRLAEGARNGIRIVDLASGTRELAAQGVFDRSGGLAWSPDDEWLLVYGAANGSASPRWWAWNLSQERLVSLEDAGESEGGIVWSSPTDLLYCAAAKQLRAVSVGDGAAAVEVAVDTPVVPAGLHDLFYCLGEDMDARIVTP